MRFKLKNDEIMESEKSLLHIEDRCEHIKTQPCFREGQKPPSTLQFKVFYSTQTLH